MVQISTKTLLIKLHKFKYNLITESCEHPLRFPVSAHLCSMSTSIISWYKQPSYVNHCNSDTESGDYNSKTGDYKQGQ